MEKMQDLEEVVAGYTKQWCLLVDRLGWFRPEVIGAGEKFWALMFPGNIIECRRYTDNTYWAVPDSGSLYAEIQPLMVKRRL